MRLWFRSQTTNLGFAFGVLLVTLCGITMPSEGINIQVYGSWSLFIDSRYLTPGGLQQSYESSRDQIHVEISDAKQISWKLDVHRHDVDWHNDLELRLKRGGREIVVDTTSQVFLTGRGNKAYDFQLLLDNVSLQIPPGNYATTIVYTVTPE